MDGSISTPRNEGAIPRSGNKPLKKKWKFKKGKKSSRYQNVANKEWIHILIYIYIISYFFLFVKRNLNSEAEVWQQIAEVSYRNKRTDLCGSDCFQEGADHMPVFKVDHKFLPASNGLGRSDHMSVVPDPVSWSFCYHTTTLPRYCANSLVRYRISTLIR